MLSGQHQCVMDEKGRVAFPAAFRADFGLSAAGDDELGRFRLTQSLLSPCLVAQTEAEFAALVEKVRALPRSHPVAVNYRRFVIGTSSVVVVDRAGRVNIPKELRDHAGLARDVVWVGELDTIELWSRERFDEARRALDAAQLKDMQQYLIDHDL
jgi:MraZ protein